MFTLFPFIVTQLSVNTTTDGPSIRLLSASPGPQPLRMRPATFPQDSRLHLVLCWSPQGVADRDGLADVRDVEAEPL